MDPAIASENEKYATIVRLTAHRPNMRIAGKHAAVIAIRTRAEIPTRADLNLIFTAPEL